MLNTLFRPHRRHLKAGTREGQKLFAMLKVIPQAEAARSRPPVALALVIDTSGSMREYVDQREAERVAKTLHARSPHVETGDDRPIRGVRLDLPSKLEYAVSAIRAMVDDGHLDREDRLTLSHFDDDGETLLPLTSLSEIEPIRRAC